jgi:ribose-phosphate pyrophosphokinase
MKRLTINIPDDRGWLYEIIKYPAGEIQVRLTASGLAAATRADEYVIAANPIPDIIELAQLKSALDGFKENWFHRTLELMYLPYARADRRFVPGDSFGLDVFGTLINALNFDTVYTFDVHSSKAEYAIDNLVNLDPIHHYDEITPVIEYIGREGLVLIAPDKGAQSRYDLAALGQPVVTGNKLRDPESGKLYGFEICGDITKYAKGLIVDDICDGGGTFVGLAQEIHRINPDIKLYLYVSHGIFSKGLAPFGGDFEMLYISDFSIKTPATTDWTKVRE